MRNNPYHDWFVEQLAKSGKSQSELARHMGLKPSMVNKIVHGTRKLSSSEVADAASFFGQSAPSFDEVRESGGLRSVVVVGRVEAGAFREVDDMIDDSEREEIALPADNLFPNARIMAFDVIGDSMNALKPRPILEGDRVIAVAYEDIAHLKPLRDGLVVVVERSHNSGMMREWSVKQLEIFDDHYEFHPRSSNRKHKPILVERDLSADDGTTVEIIAVVRRVVNDIQFN
ncbi:LexA family protein [Aureimonas phyllosphaerae]|uniref:Transcriptional regulator with XRE-family HTH domain n=1 Tax=Aureimonas phyllosphaerae TaxID=1166078 RepID=A0A7W6BTS6_9HYPH|nr:LexA family transcriptional regulator [Aureimonas phyllosphaerae]MBB3937911.1 transcriptional regulator with XRE-family HTH domain [Aureimonas phyllosphaerae]MBB3961916.1 transcriptional regulator with XRE-family HTH domain [Aureimonas phyllosphaerae]